jgi:hypothetical protein
MFVKKKKKEQNKFECPMLMGVREGMALDLDYAFLCLRSRGGAGGVERGQVHPPPPLTSSKSFFTSYEIFFEYPFLPPPSLFIH